MLIIYCYLFIYTPYLYGNTIMVRKKKWVSFYIYNLNVMAVEKTKEEATVETPVEEVVETTEAQSRPLERNVKVFKQGYPKA